jgi:hypothetical protein
MASDVQLNRFASTKLKVYIVRYGYLYRYTTCQKDTHVLVSEGAVNRFEARICIKQTDSD